jgi:hypothetical protein
MSEPLPVSLAEALRAAFVVERNRARSLPLAQGRQ